MIIFMNVISMQLFLLPLITNQFISFFAVAFYRTNGNPTFRLYHWKMFFNKINAPYQPTQLTHDVKITSLLRQNDVATSFWRNDNVTFTSCVRWESSDFLCGHVIFQVPMEHTESIQGYNLNLPFMLSLDLFYSHYSDVTLVFTTSQVTGN